MTPATLLEELLRYRQASKSQTASLAEYTHDDLCRKIEDQIELMLGSFRKYQNISYMVQGPRDQGVDVLIKSTDKKDEPEKYIALQVKSHRELDDKSNDLSKQLKSGYFDAKDRYDCHLLRYYILLAGDADKHKNRLTAITNEFARASDIRIINSRYLLTFLKMPQSTIAAIVDRHLGEEDYVCKKARTEASGYKSAELQVILACISQALENANDHLPDEFFERNPLIMNIKENYGPSEVSDCISYFSDTELEVYAQPTRNRFRIELFPGIRALYYDFQVRYEETSDDLVNHLFEFLNEDILDEEDNEDGATPLPTAAF